MPRPATSTPASTASAGLGTSGVPPPDGHLVVALSSRALFDFEAENRVFESTDDHAYMQLQLQQLDEPARPGVAFALARKLLAFNAGSAERQVEVVILSRNDPVSGLRVFRSAQHYGLDIERGVFTRGESPWRYLRPLNAQLFLSANEADVRSGLQAFQHHERSQAATPLAPGPFKPLLLALLRLHQAGSASGMRVRTALVTARSAPAHERAIRTLMDWRIEVDEAMFLGGLPKGEFLREFEPDFFFDY